MRGAALVLLALGAAMSRAEEGDRHSFTGALDLSVVVADSPLDSWLERGQGKLRFDQEHDGVAYSRAFLDYRSRITDTVNARVALDSVDSISNAIDLTEAFLEWRPVPRSAWRFRSRLGAFYPKLSVENTDAGWSNAYGLSSSVINTWIGEELRAVGAELRATRVLTSLPGHSLSVEGGAFYGNDPTGALLTWRGWAAHDRQTGLFSSVPTPEVSAIAPWDPGGEPLPKYDPFDEIDHDPGFYAGAEWNWEGRARIKAFHYDNHADPEAVNAAGEYAWQTWFDHVGAEFELPCRTALLAQWIGGATRMGPDLGPWRVQDVDFDAAFVTLTGALGERHRLSLRYEWFDIQPFDDPEGVTNRDDGAAWAASWLFQATEHVRIGAEYLAIATDHCASQSCIWVWNGLPRTTRENTFQLTLRWRFDAAL
jgi:hypothetical protein